MCFNLKTFIIKKIITTLVLLIGFTASSQAGNFKKTSNNKLVWVKIYDKVLDIESQTIDLTAPSSFNTAIYLKTIKNARMTVEVKEGRTRIYIDRIMNGNIIGTNLRILDSPVLEDISPVVISGKKGAFKKFFIKRDAKKLDKIISNAIDSLIEEGQW